MSKHEWFRWIRRMLGFIVAYVVLYMILLILELIQWNSTYMKIAVCITWFVICTTIGNKIRWDK